MLTAMRRSDTAKVTARDSERTEAPFQCPTCQREVTLHKGRIKVHHFAHKPPVTCARGIGESEAHLQAKLAIFDALKREGNVADLEIERDCGISVADVFARISGTPVAIEIQRSALSANQINARTQNYHRLGIAVLWIALPSPDLATSKYSPSAWEKWCHATYYGRIYYWDQGQVLKVAHFDPYVIEVPHSTWYEGGSERSAGGYDKRSKRWRTPRLGIPVLISASFHRSHREAWQGGTVAIPECSIYLDRQTKWWK
ncbi:MAG: competence protein CoiA family protein [Burkholderiaceae bacterium]|nr:competence protein CoiA family protein [Burkholderiaceae bacterium]